MHCTRSRSPTGLRPLQKDGDELQRADVKNVVELVQVIVDITVNSGAAKSV